MERMTRKTIPVRKVLDVASTDGKIIIFMKLEEEEDKEEIIGKCDKIWRKWEVGVDGRGTIPGGKSL